MGCKMIIIKNRRCKVTFINVYDNFLYLKDIFVFIIYLLQGTVLFTLNVVYGKLFQVHLEISDILKNS